MPWQRKSKQKAERVVRHTLRDGTVREYRYKSYTPRERPKDTLSAMIEAYRDSPEWNGLSPATKTNYSIYLRPLDEVGHLDPISVKRRGILELRDAIAAKRGKGAAV